LAPSRSSLDTHQVFQSAYMSHRVCIVLSPSSISDVSALIHQNIIVSTYLPGTKQLEQSPLTFINIVADWYYILCLCTAIYTEDADMITMNNHMQVMCFQWLYFIHCPTYSNPTAKPCFFDKGTVVGLATYHWFRCCIIWHAQHNNQRWIDSTSVYPKVAGCSDNNGGMAVYYNIKMPLLIKDLLF